MKNVHDDSGIFSFPSALTRRSFLKGTALAATAVGTTGLVACAPKGEEGKPTEKKEPIKEDVYPGVCRSFCTGACLLNLHIRDGKLMRTSMREMPEECYNRICLKGYTHPYREYSPKRILNPMRRAGERGEGKWEQITWDEAIAEIAEKWKAITDQYGPSAMACYTGPAGNRGAAGGNGSGALLTRFKKAVGMTTVNSAVDGAGNYAPSRMLGGSYFRVANEIKDIINAKTIFIWGACPSVSQVHNVHFITEARSKGAKVITIDPLYNANASIADQYVPLRAGTDGALALGMMNAVVENGWVDTEFITKHSVAPFLVKPDTHKFLRLSDLGRAEAKSDADKIVVMGKDGTVDIPENIPDPVIEGTFDVEGQSVITAYTLLLERIAEWPVERAAGITGISAADIVELTRTMCVDSPTTIYTVFGADHYYNGHWNYTCMTALAILTGNLGKPGAGFCGSASAGTLYQNLKEVSNVPCPIEKTQSLPAYSMAETILTGTHNGKPFDLRGLFVNFGDPVANIASRDKTIEAVKALDFLVVSDIMFSETAAYADILLPACYWFECEDMMSQLSSHPYLVYSAAALDPLGESKSDFDIFKLIAEALGYGEHFDYDLASWMTMLMDTDEAKELDMTYDALKEKEALRTIPGTSDKAYVYAEGGVFLTPSKRAQFYQEAPKASTNNPDAWDFDKEYLPYWEPPLEVWDDSEGREKHPFNLVSEHSRFRTHTQFGDVEALLEIDTEQFVYINPDDAIELGIADGDEVKVHNDRGYLVAHACIRPNNPRGVLSAVKGWMPDQVIEGHLSSLGTLVSNLFCANQPFNDCAVAIEKK